VSRQQNSPAEGARASPRVGAWNNATFGLPFRCPPGAIFRAAFVGSPQRHRSADFTRGRSQ